MSWLQCTFLLLIAAVSADNLITYKIPITNELKKTLGYPEGCYLNFTELTTKQGYDSEQHTVTTEDGYILTIFRMKSPKCTQIQGSPVLILHGVFLTSDEFLNPGVEAGWPYLLADSCYDVWLGNNRGNAYSRAHQTLDPDKDAKFWDFSIDEIGKYDGPATIDYILETVGSEKINLIGYSLGTHSVLSMLSQRPQYNSKVDVNVVLSFSSTIHNIRPLAFKLLFFVFYMFGETLRTFGIHEVFFKNSIEHVILEFVCQHESLTAECNTIIGILDTVRPDSLSDGAVRTFFSSFLSGSSVKIINQLSANWVKDGFYMYDYGAESNLVRYGSEEAPEFNISAVVAPTLIVHGLDDQIAITKDVSKLASKLTNLLEWFTPTDPKWNHVDSGWSKNIPSMVYGRVDQYFNKTATPLAATTTLSAANGI